jgi:hypothetical protein
MALTDNLLAGLLAYGTGERQECTTTNSHTTPRMSHEEDNVPAPFEVSQDKTLGFPMATNDEEAIASVTATPTIPMQTQEPAPPTTMNRGALLKLVQRLATASSPRQLACEFCWQHTARTDTNKFKEEALAPSTRPRVFGFLQTKSPFVHTLHSPAKFFELEAAVELQGKVIAFVCDRSARNQPHPMALPDRNAWEWKTAPIVTDAVAAAAFFAAPEHEKEVWRPAGLQNSQESLPRLLYLPTQVAAFALERP